MRIASLSVLDEGGILDPDDRLAAVADDRDQVSSTLSSLSRAISDELLVRLISNFITLVSWVFAITFHVN